MGNKKAGLEVTLNENIEKDLNIESYIGEILDNTNFDSLNFLRVHESEKNRKIAEENGLENAEFISIDIDSLAPYASMISEKEFFKIVGANEKNIYKRSGKYQESLYSNYLEAKKELDKGYMVDVLAKAMTLRNNIEYAQSLTKDAKFMREWRRNFGNESPVSNIKKTGSLRRINIVKERIE